MLVADRTSLQAAAEDFRRAAIPRLAGVCEIHGRRIARGAGTLAAAETATMRIARDLGADRLAADLLADLAGWIAERVRAEAARARATLAISRRESRW